MTKLTPELDYWGHLNALTEDAESDGWVVGVAAPEVKLPTLFWVCRGRGPAHLALVQPDLPPGTLRYKGFGFERKHHRIDDAAELALLAWKPFEHAITVPDNPREKVDPAKQQAILRKMNPGLYDGEGGE